MRVLGIDCATKSLAVSIVDFNDNWHVDLYEITTTCSKNYKLAKTTSEKISILLDRVNKVKLLFDRLITLKYVNVFDLIPGRFLDGISTTLKLSRLKSVLKHIKSVNKCLGMDYFNKVLVEYQMSANDKSRCISNALVYEFSSSDSNIYSANKTYDIEIEASYQETVEIVGPALKSKVFFEEAGRIQNFRKKYINNYTANKAHSKYNFNKWVNSHNYSNLVESIPKKNIDDVADSFLMSYAWCIKTYIV